MSVVGSAMGCFFCAGLKRHLSHVVLPACGMPVVMSSTRERGSPRNCGGMSDAHVPQRTCSVNVCAGSNVG